MHSSITLVSSEEIIAQAKNPSLHILNFGIINPALLPSPPASASTSSILPTTLDSPTLEKSNLTDAGPWLFANFSIDMLVSMLVTNFFIPRFSALATQSNKGGPEVTSYRSFLPPQ